MVAADGDDAAVAHVSLCCSACVPDSPACAAGGDDAAGVQVPGAQSHAPDAR